MPTIVANCVIRVPSLIGVYVTLGLTHGELIQVAVDHINKGDVAFTEHPEYQRSGCVFSDTIVELAVEILQLLPYELESDFDHLVIVEFKEADVLLQLQFTDVGYPC